MLGPPLSGNPSPPSGLTLSARASAATLLAADVLRPAPDDAFTSEPLFEARCCCGGG